jgi:SAM-dependent methyltransferase
MKEIQIPTVKPALKQLIQDGIGLAYTSVSCMDRVETGNHYQSVTLGDEHTGGFRSGREAILNQIDFRWKRVLDLGSNLGEISRAARARGAVLVDGYEYDPFFVELANALNAYNGTTRVSFYERDITDPGIYREQYDIVLALSVYVYLREVFDAVSEITNGVLILETHRLDGNLESTYLEPIGKLFPHHAILGTSEWGSGFDTSVERAVIAFAKTDEALHSYVGDYREAALQFSPARRTGAGRDIRRIDVRQTAWYDRFFTTFAFDSPEKMFTSLENREVNIDPLASDGDLAMEGMGGWLYWLVYVQGALQRARGGAIGPGNIYYDLLAKNWINDRGRAADFGDPDRLVMLVKRRFDDFDLFRSDPDAPAKMSPIHLLVPDSPPAPTEAIDVKRVYDFERGTSVDTTKIDGYHRLFLARLFGHSSVPGDFVAQRDAEPDEHA